MSQSACLVLYIYSDATIDRHSRCSRVDRRHAACRHHARRRGSLPVVKSHQTWQLCVEKSQMTWKSFLCRKKGQKGCYDSSAGYSSRQKGRWSYRRSGREEAVEINLRQEAIAFPVRKYKVNSPCNLSSNDLGHERRPSFLGLYFLLTSLRSLVLSMTLHG